MGKFERFFGCFASRFHLLKYDYQYKLETTYTISIKRWLTLLSNQPGQQDKKKKALAKGRRLLPKIKNKQGKLIYNRELAAKTAIVRLYNRLSMLDRHLVAGSLVISKRYHS